MVLKEILFENIMYEKMREILNYCQFLIKIFMMISQTECNRINTVSVLKNAMQNCGCGFQIENKSMVMESVIFHSSINC